MQDGAHGLAQIVEIRVLPDECVHVQIIGTGHIGRAIGARKHHDRDPPKQGMPLDILQHVKTVFSRHMKVEKQQVRSIGLGGTFVHGSDRLMTVMDGLEIVRNSGSFECDLDEPCDRPIVLSQNNPSRPSALGICKH